MNTKVIIVGAGAAGLMAAKTLTAKGIDVLLIEASDKLGGRINTISDTSFDTVIETGAEFIHGRLPLTIELLREAAIPFHPVGEKRFFVKNGEWQLPDAPIPYWDILLQKMEQVKEDITIAHFLQTYFSEDKYTDLRSNVKRYAEGFDLADINRASTISLRDEWACEEETQYRIEGGYSRLIQYMEKACVEKGAIIHVSSIVTRIEWKNDEVKVYTEQEVFEADKVIVTVPLSMLKKEIDFLPAITDYTNAVAQIGYGSVIKVFLQFEEPFWEEREKELSFVFSDRMIPTWWTQSPVKSALLTGWLGGPNATALKGADEGIILNLALESLAAIFSVEIDHLYDLLKEWVIADWSQQPFIYGAYSFATVEAAGAKELLQQGIHQTIFFAGEAMYSGDSPGTVEAALTSGRDVAAKIII